MHDLIVSFVIFAVGHLQPFHQFAFYLCIINIEILIITNLNCNNSVLFIAISAINYLTEFSTVKRTDYVVAIINHYSSCKLLINFCIVIQILEFTSLAIASHEALGIFPGFITIFIIEICIRICYLIIIFDIHNIFSIVVVR